MGFLQYDVPPGHRLFKEITPCPVCGPARQQEYLARICGLSDEMRDWTFANTRRTEGNAQAYDTAQALAANPQWLYSLQGAFGTGKTRLLTCLVNAGRAHGWTSVYVTMAELLDHLRRAYGPNIEHMEFDGLWDKVINARILALDECDRFSPTAWAREKFFELVDARYRRGAECLTAFATNAEIDSLDGYLASRMRGRNSWVFELTGADLRQVDTKEATRYGRE